MHAHQTKAKQTRTSFIHACPMKISTHTNYIDAKL